jgi:hypothetical protein
LSHNCVNCQPCGIDIANLYVFAGANKYAGDLLTRIANKDDRPLFNNLIENYAVELTDGDRSSERR